MSVIKKIRSAPIPLRKERDPNNPRPRSDEPDLFEQEPLLTGGERRGRMSNPIASTTSRSSYSIRSSTDLDDAMPGDQFCEEMLAQIRRIKSSNPSQRCYVVFDLDNTLFETRARTLQILKRYDQLHKTSYFDHLTINEMEWTGALTCQKLKEKRSIPDSVVKEVGDFWEEEFWNGQNFDADLVVSSLFDLAWRAKHAGAEVAYLTGRIEDLKEDSVDQVRQAGLPCADTRHVFCKPDLETKTSPFKAEQLHQWRAAGIHIGWFITDNKREIDGIRNSMNDAPCVFMAHDLQHGETCDRSTPMLPSSWTKELSKPGTRKPPLSEETATLVTKA